MAGITEFTPEFFDNASNAWRANKVPVGEGSFRYKRNAFPPLPLAVHVPLFQETTLDQKKEPVKLRRSARIQLRLRFTRELARLKK